MSTQTITSTDNLSTFSISSEKNQYTLWQILGIWVSAALPMALSYWVIVPTLISRGNTYPFTYLFLMITGMVWEGVLAYILLKREVKPFTWQGVKDRLWLYTPSDPKTGICSKWLFLGLIPLIGFAFIAGSKLGWLNDIWVKALPFLAPRPYGVIQNMATPALGQWWLLGVLAMQVTFNYLLGEELIFRGILLPKMNGVFGKWDWLANHLLFTAYHVHFFWTTPTRLLVNWVYAWSTKRFKSYWMGVIIHGFETPFLFLSFILAIKGLVSN